MARHKLLATTVMAGAFAIYATNAGAKVAGTLAGPSSPQPPKPQAAAASATPNATQVGEVIVTAERRSSTLKNTPISMSVLPGKALDQSNLTGLTDILNTVPGVAATVDPFSGGSQVTIRGVSAAGPTFAGAGTVSYYLDGIPFGFVRSAVGPDLDPYDLSQVEILRGPQGTLYGAGGLNGVIRVNTNDPSLTSYDAKARATLSGTDHGGANYGGDVELNVPVIDDKLGVRVTLGDNYYDGWINSKNAKGVNTADLVNYRVKILARPVENLDVGFTFWRTDNSYGAASDGDSNYFNNDVAPAHLSSMYDGYGLRLGYTAPWFTATSQTSYLSYASTGGTDLNPVGLPNFQGVTDLSSHIFTEEVDLASKNSGPFKWNAGVFYRDATDKVFQPFITPKSFLIFDNFSDESKSWAVYGEVGQKFLDNKLEWTLGLRYFHDSATNLNLSPSALGPVNLSPVNADFHAVTPRAILQWYPDPRQTFYVSYSQGFRSGIIQDEEVQVVAPNVPPANPDRLHNFELGSKSNLFSGRVDVEAAVFYIDWEHVQQLVQTPVAFDVYTDAIINGSSASGPGAEASINAHVTSNLTVSGNFSWNGLTQDKDVFSAGVLLFNQGERLNYSPEYTAGASAEYRFPVGGSGFVGRVGGAFNYTSSQFDTTLRGNARYVLQGDEIYALNAHLAFDSPNRKWTTTLFGNNLTNDNGSPIKSPSTVYFDTRVRPLTAGIQVDYHY